VLRASLNEQSSPIFILGHHLKYFTIYHKTIDIKRAYSAPDLLQNPVFSKDKKPKIKPVKKIIHR
jgi:hypothetical protein